MKYLYDEDYFERGLETGKSCYQNYRWIPELTIPMAMTMIDYLGIKPLDSILDIGCAKGYLVKAFRWLNRTAYGIDISEYAVNNCDPDVIEYVDLIRSVSEVYNYQSDFAIAKDVFEHMGVSEIKEILENVRARFFFVVVPLGDGSKFRAPANDLDKSHCNCWDENKWTHLFKKSKWSIFDFNFMIRGIKDSYYDKYPKAHGFWYLERR